MKCCPISPSSYSQGMKSVFLSIPPVCFLSAVRFDFSLVPSEWHAAVFGPSLCLLARFQCYLVAILLQVMFIWADPHLHHKSGSRSWWSCRCVEGAMISDYITTQRMHTPRTRVIECPEGRTEGLIATTKSPFPAIVRSRRC